MGTILEFVVGAVAVPAALVVRVGARLGEMVQTAAGVTMSRAGGALRRSLIWANLKSAAWGGRVRRAARCVTKRKGDREGYLPSGSGLGSPDSTGALDRAEHQT